MLLHGHQLNRVVACVCDTGKYAIGKLTISSYACILLRHTNVRLIDPTSALLNSKIRMSPTIALSRRPDLCTKELRSWVLNNPTTEGWNSLCTDLTTVLMPEH